MTSYQEVCVIPSRQEKMRIGRPFAISALTHAALVFMLMWFAPQLALKPLESIKVLEINVVGPEDLALKETGGDYSAGPLSASAPLAQPAEDIRKVTKGNTPKNSRAVSGRAAPATDIRPVLKAKGPLFSSAESAVQPGVEREKIYVSASVIRHRADEVNKGGPKGEGLVGVAGAPIDLNAERGGGGKEGGEAVLLSGGKSSVAGDAVLSRRGLPILEEAWVSDGTILQSKKRSAKLEAPSDDFFSISGPLRGRKILQMSIPKYPRWAEEQGVETTVSLRITVTARGKVKPEILLEQTSGFPEFDKVVADAVKKIVFAPLGPGAGNLEQWGVVTFNFKLKKKARDQA